MNHGDTEARRREDKTETRERRHSREGIPPFARVLQMEKAERETKCWPLDACPEPCPTCPPQLTARRRKSLGPCAGSWISVKRSPSSFSPMQTVDNVQMLTPAYTTPAGSPGR